MFSVKGYKYSGELTHTTPYPNRHCTNMGITQTSTRIGASMLWHLPRSKKPATARKHWSRGQIPGICLQDSWSYLQIHLTYQILNVLICKMRWWWHLPYLVMVRIKRDNTWEHSPQRMSSRNICSLLLPIPSSLPLKPYLWWTSPAYLIPHLGVSSLCTTVDLTIYFTPIRISKKVIVMFFWV